MDYIAWLQSPFGRSSSDVALMPFNDSARHIRTAVDHNGYLIGASSRFEETWATPEDVTIVNGPFGNWEVSLNGTGGLGHSSADFGFGSGLMYATGAASGDYSRMYTGYRASAGPFSCHMFFKDFSSIVCEWIGVLDIGTDHLKTTFGLFDVSSGNQCVFYRSSTTNPGNWRSYTYSGAASDQSTGVASTGSGFHVFRIELHGKDSPYGTALSHSKGMVRYFIDGTLVSSDSTTSAGILPSAGQRYGFYWENKAEAASNLSSSGLGPVVMCWNHSLVPTSP